MWEDLRPLLPSTRACLRALFDSPDRIAQHIVALRGQIDYLVAMTFQNGRDSSNYWKTWQGLYLFLEKKMDVVHIPMMNQEQSEMQYKK